MKIIKQIINRFKIALIKHEIDVITHRVYFNDSAMKRAMFRVKYLEDKLQQLSNL